jgi:serine/threonine protein kinase
VYVDISPLIFPVALIEQEREILTSLRKNGIFIPEVVDIQNIQALVMKPVLKNFSGPLEPTVQHVKDLFMTLTHIHEKGYLHRDIRKDNIMTNEINAYLIDFGFAVKENGAALPFQGAVSTASDRVLGQLVAGNLKFLYTQADDVVSLVKVSSSFFSFLPLWLRQCLLLLLGSLPFGQPESDAVAPSSNTVCDIACLLEEYSRVLGQRH